MNEKIPNRHRIACCGVCDFYIEGSFEHTLRNANILWPFGECEKYHIKGVHYSELCDSFEDD
jgi:hypothetical protein